MLYFSSEVKMEDPKEKGAPTVNLLPTTLRPLCNAFN